ncbi:MAG: hypothetical protein OQL28_01975 [Sedimenticola sp.]|nr:hypothetical protein [Sedimenticola sp.]
MSGGIAVGAVGWDHPGWAEHFYPDDLPSEWRLTYYGNEFHQVLVPAGYWRQGEAPWEQWREDVDPSFRFVLEAGDPARLGGSDLQRIEAAAATLREQLAGVVSWQPLPDDRADVLRRILNQGRFLASVSAVASEGYTLATGDGVACARVESGRTTDLRDLRGLMQELQACACGEGGRWLFVEGAPPQIKLLRDAVILQQLLAGAAPTGPDRA